MTVLFHKDHVFRVSNYLDEFNYTYFDKGLEVCILIQLLPTFKLTSAPGITFQLVLLRRFTIFILLYLMFLFIDT